MRIKFTITAAIVLASLTRVNAQGKFAIIHGSTNSLKDSDMVSLTVNRLGTPFDGDTSAYCAIIEKHSYIFRIAVNSRPLNILLLFREKTIDRKHANMLNQLAMFNYYIQKGDNVFINENNGAFIFSGKGSTKYNLIYKLNQIDKKFDTGVSWDDPYGAKVYFQRKDSAFLNKMRILEVYKKKLEPAIYSIIKAQIIGDNLSKGLFVYSLPDSLIRLAKSDLRNYKNFIPSKYYDTRQLNTQNSLKYSGAYTFGLRQKFLYDSCTYPQPRFTIKRSFNYFLHNFSGGLRERLLFNEIYLNRESTEDITNYVRLSLNVIKDRKFRAILKEIEKQRMPGAPAYEFSLPDTSGKIRTFSEFKGKVVLMDFWFTGCGSCLRSAPYIRKMEEYFKGQPIVFITINDDNSKQLWLKNVRTRKYTSEYSLDLFTDGKAFKSDINKYYNVEYCPVLILIGKNGKLAPNPGNPLIDEGQGLLESLKKEINK